MIYRQLANLLKSARPRKRGRGSQPAHAGRRMGFLEPLEPRRMLAGDPGDLDGSFGHLDVDGRTGFFSGEFELNHDELFEAVGQQQDGKLVFAGSSSAHGETDVDVVVARLNVNGTPDADFGSNGSVVIELEEQQLVEDLVIDGLDRIIVVGQTGNQAFAVRLSPDGTLDSGFGNAGLATLPLAQASSAQSVVLDASGRIVVAGTYGTGSARDFFVGRFLSDGTPDASFSGDGVEITDVGGGSDTARDVAIAPGGKILVAGTIAPNNGTPFRMGIARYNDDGTPDNSFGDSEPTNGGNVVTIGWEDFPPFTSRAVTATAMEVLPLGQIVVAGTIPVGGAGSDIAVARLTPNGELDEGFDGNGTLTLNINHQDTDSSTLGGPFLALEQPDSFGDAKVLIGTSVWINDLQIDTRDKWFGIARISKDGSVLESSGGYKVETEFPPQSENGDAWHLLNDILVQADGRVVAAGSVWFVADVANPGTQDFQLAAARYLTDLGDPPVAEANGSYSVAENGMVQLSSSGSTGTAPLTFEWDLDGDGLFGETGGDAVRGDENVANPTFHAVELPPATTEVTVRLRVTNERGLWDYDFATIAIVLNTPPTVDVENATIAIDEGTTAQNFGSFSDPDNDSVILAASIGTIIDDGDGTWSWSFDASDGPDETQTVTITATDSNGAATSTTFELTVDNVAPTANAGADQTANEGALVSLDGSFTDPGLADTHTFLWQVTASNGQVIADGTNEDFSFTPNDNGTYTINYTVTDDDGDADTDEVIVTVNNLPPTADAGGPYSTVPGGTVSLDATASSDPADSLTFEWDFDDDGLFDDATGSNPVYDPATYGVAPGGTGTVSVRVSDGDGGSDEAMTTVSVVGPGIVLTGGTLFTVGSTGGDSVTIQMVDGQVVVTSALIPEGSESFDPNDVQLIVVTAGDGDDIVSIANSVAIDVQMSGGAGNDLLMSGGGDDLVLGGSGNDLILTQGGDDVVLGGEGADLIYAGAGNNVIIGGTGADQLLGGSGRDLIIGSDGSDWLWGNGGEDLLIGGSTDYDAYDASDAQAIEEIMGIWTSDSMYGDRVSMLTAPGGRLAPGTAIFSNDDDTDVYIGGSGRDLYFADLDGSGDDDLLLFSSILEEVVEL